MVEPLGTLTITAKVMHERRVETRAGALAMLITDRFGCCEGVKAGFVDVRSKVVCEELVLSRS